MKDEVEQNEEEEKVTEKSNIQSNKWEIYLKEIESAIFPLITSIIAAATLTTFFFDSTIQIGKRNSLSESEKMFAYLQKGVERGEFSEDFFNTAFNHFDRKSDGKLGKYGRAELIEDFIVYLNSMSNGEKTPKSDSVNQFLSRIKAVEPFSALPAEERRLMDHLQLLVTNKENLEPVVQTLNELKQVILVRHKEYQRIEAQNSWSLPLSFIGVFLTLVFGIWTTVLSVKQSRSRYLETHREIVEHRSDGTTIHRTFLL